MIVFVIGTELARSADVAELARRCVKTILHREAKDKTQREQNDMLFKGTIEMKEIK